MRSDVGTHLAALSKEIQDINECWDWERIKILGVHCGMEWEFCKSVDAPWVL